jgi:hypothetical protein
MRRPRGRPSGNISFAIARLMMMTGVEFAASWAVKARPSTIGMPMVAK